MPPSSPEFPRTHAGHRRRVLTAGTSVLVWLLLLAAVLAGVLAAGKLVLSRSSSKVPSRRQVGSTKLTPACVAQSGDLFEDATAKAGISFVHQFCDTRIANILESNGAGGCWLDFDGDGWMDLYLVNSGPLEKVTHHTAGTVRKPNALYRNRRDGTFEDVTKRAGLEGSGYCSAAIAGDFDNDGHTDLFVVGIGHSTLYHNRGDGTFEDVTAKAGVANRGGTGIGAVFLDADNDGYLDLFVANYLEFDPAFRSGFHPESPYPGPLAYKAQSNRLYRNRGDGTFEDVSEKSGVLVPGHRAMSVTVFDYNLDGAPDIYLSNDGTANVLLVNDGHGHFQDQALSAGVAFNGMGEAAGSMAATVGDCNGDGLQDIFVTRLGYGSLYIGTTKGVYEDRMAVSGLGNLTSRFVGWGGSFLDFDNDGDLDVFVANGDALYLLGSESLLLENSGNGTFTDAGRRGGSIFSQAVRGRGSAVADYDNDGRMDVIMTAIADRPFLLHNQGRTGNHWLTLDLQGTRSNRDGFGALIRLEAGGKELNAQARCGFGFLMQSDRRVHFGLGKAQTAEKIEIRWPSGKVQELLNVKADQIMKVKEES